MSNEQRRRWIEGHWVLDIDTLEVAYIPPGEYPENERPEATIRVSTHLLPSLFEMARDGGLLPVTPQRASREEDLKIIHRLLDLMGKER